MKGGSSSIPTKAAGLLIVGVLLLPSAMAGATAVEARFARPAQAEGSVRAQGLRWALLAFDPHSAAGFDLTADAGSATSNLTRTYAQYGGDTPPVIGVPGAIPPQNRTLDGPVDAQAGFGRAWGSLYVEADSLSLQAVQAPLEMDRIFAGQSARENLATKQVPVSAWEYAPWAMTPGPGVTLGLGDTTPASGFRFKLQASGIHALEWHNAVISCRTSSCPDGGWASRTRTDSPVPFVLAVDSYISLRTSGGTLAGGGTALLISAGGPRLDVGLAGSLRLPEASLKGRCPKGPCPDPAGRTFLAQGNLTLDGLGPDADDRRLDAHLAGAFASASFDESPMSAFRLGTGIAAVGLGLALFGVLVKSLWARLFVRSKRPAALESQRRRTVFDTIQSVPGVSFRELQRRLGWAHGTLRNHVQRLLEDRVITAHSHKNTVRYFENHGLFKNRWLPTAHLQDPDTRRLHEWLLAHPLAGQSQVTRESHRWGWSRAKALRRLADLEAAGLVSVRRQGLRVHYQAHAPPPANSVVASF